MSKRNQLSEIISVYESILENNPIKEASSASDELLGGTSVTIPASGAHTGQSGWQSSNAWDIAAPIGTPVYALADGVAETYSDYGRQVVSKDGKRLYGQSFTVKSDKGLPSIYYTHLEGSTIRQGLKIKCGQLLGYVMDFPNSSYDHVHIGVETGDIKQFLNSDGSIKCAKGQDLSKIKVDKSTIDDEGSPESSKVSDLDPMLLNIGRQLGKFIGLKEQYDFGKSVQNRYGTLIIPGDKNPKIKSPINGKVNNTKYTSGCKNQITIQDENKKFYLEFCGITNINVTDGQKISKGDLLGITTDDVKVKMYNQNFSEIPIDSKQSTDLSKDRKPEEYKKGSTERTYTDPLIASMLTLPASIFKDKYDEKTGELKQKRWGSPTDKRQVDPWIKDAITSPFKKIAKVFKKNESKIEEQKLNEDIQRIKDLLK